MIKSKLLALRIIAILEGLSFVVLLFVAMPLKYALNIPEPVSVIGMAHGLLFVLYLIALAYYASVYAFTTREIFASALAAFWPFGTFWADRTIFKKIDQQQDLADK